MTCYLTQLHYPDTEPTSPSHPLIMPNTRLGCDKYHFFLNIDLSRPGFENCEVRIRSCYLKIPRSPRRAVDALLIRPPRLVILELWLVDVMWWRWVGVAGCWLLEISTSSCVFWAHVGVRQEVVFRMPETDCCLMGPGCFDSKDVCVWCTSS